MKGLRSEKGCLPQHFSDLCVLDIKMQRERWCSWPIASRVRRRPLRRNAHYPRVLPAAAAAATTFKNI
jgi:hypothetical protein